jgi:hypothetical protein
MGFFVKTWRSAKLLLLLLHTNKGTTQTMTARHSCANVRENLQLITGHGARAMHVEFLKLMDFFYTDPLPRRIQKRAQQAHFS